MVCPSSRTCGVLQMCVFKIVDICKHATYAQIKGRQVNPRSLIYETDFPSIIITSLQHQNEERELTNMPPLHISLFFFRLHYFVILLKSFYQYRY